MVYLTITVNRKFSTLILYQVTLENTNVCCCIVRDTQCADSEMPVTLEGNRKYPCSNRTLHRKGKFNAIRWEKIIRRKSPRQYGSLVEH